MTSLAVLVMQELRVICAPAFGIRAAFMRSAPFRVIVTIVTTLVVEAIKRARPMSFAKRTACAMPGLGK